MTQSRKSQVSLEDTPYYHCISRCVRRAYLCGEDKYSGNSFSHRRQWMIERMHYLASIFNINLCAYAIMSNHYHLVLHIDEAENLQLTDAQVCQRWGELYSMPLIIERWQQQNASDIVNAEALNIINKWRGRLVDISWFMRCLNEFIARKANKEDECSGRFWEGRFKSQALLDEDALLTCMAYVDLNPVRAKMADCIENSEYTSAYERVHGVAHENEDVTKYHFTKKPLLGFNADAQDDEPLGIPFSLLDYIELVDWSSRIIRQDKHGAVSSGHPVLLASMGLESDAWLSLARNFGKEYQGAVGSLEELASFAEHTGKHWIASKNQLRRKLH